MPDAATWIPQLTNDGSFTFFSEEFNETFHSSQGAKAEAFLKFAKATDLVEKAQQGRVRLLDVCYGLGYNTAAALETIWTANADCQVEVYGLELDATVPQAAIAPPLIESWSPTVQTILIALAKEHEYKSDRLHAKILLGDARQTIQSLAASQFQADAIFFDPFSPRRCPQLWTVEFYTQVVGCLAPTGKLATYSRSASVRSAMQAAGLCIGTIPLSEEAVYESHEWSQGTIGSFNSETLHPLSQMEQEHLQTRAAIPLRDPDLSNRAETILQRQKDEQSQSQRESTSSWRRRWGIK
ncbi:MAG: hypothetical protein KME12_04400 [Trichocoleus desertorum ATA4-8-CV12]|jgi:tRNA U34 5-methylaminomethyl-2-thiouridine-forming methyltransferase MnmC|nr:hypothetical protein [Trichocoleus desertorum ATA4-8-CV12]